MPSEKVVAYHRSFLSPDYLDNLVPPTASQRLKKHAAEVDAVKAEGPGRV